MLQIKYPWHIDIRQTTFFMSDCAWDFVRNWDFPDQWPEDMEPGGSEKWALLWLLVQIPPEWIS